MKGAFGRVISCDEEKELSIIELAPTSEERNTAQQFVAHWQHIVDRFPKWLAVGECVQFRTRRGARHEARAIRVVPSELVERKEWGLILQRMRNSRQAKKCNERRKKRQKFVKQICEHIIASEPASTVPELLAERARTRRGECNV